MKVLLGPTNYASQPVALMQALRERGVEARHVLYAWNKRSTGYGYRTDRVAKLDARSWPAVQIETLGWALAERFDIYHLWNRSLLCPPGGFGFFSGLDLPIIRAQGAKIIYRFTGYDLRRRSLDMELNPYSPFHAGFEMPYDEQLQTEYLAHLRQFVDAFVVQDPEMGAFLPEAEVIPRGIDLDQLPHVGVEPKTVPLIVHAPSNPELKGSAHVQAAVEALRARGLQFEFKLIQEMKHEDAIGWYKRADIIIDQLLIGWYGVLAIEGMALGKPVIAYVREPLYSKFKPALPIVNANPDDLADRLAELILDPQLRVDAGRRGRPFAEEVHDIRSVAAETERLYQHVAASPSAPGGDVAYLRSRSGELSELFGKARQWDRWSGELRELRRKASQLEQTEAQLAEANARLRTLRHPQRRDAGDGSYADAPADLSGIQARLAALEAEARQFRRNRSRLDASVDS
jgi:Glycosyl transferases group 1